MDKLNIGRLCREIVERYAQEPAPPGIEVETILDDENGHYLVFYSGWQGSKRIHGPVIHLQLRGEKLWVHFDGTEEGVAREFLDAGVPTSQIVLAWQHPSRRELTSFAAA